MRGVSPAFASRGLTQVLVVGALGVMGFVGDRPARAQTPQAPAELSFEVASVKPNASGTPFVRFSMPGGDRFSADNAPLHELIRLAYQLQGFQIVGAPDWIRSARFDIVAKAGEVLAQPALAGGVAAGPTPPVFLMLRSLLAERFKLAVHRETRELPTYTLVVARADGRPGPQLKRSETDCAALMAAMRQGQRDGNAAPPPPPPQPGSPPRCGLMNGPGRIMGGSITMAVLAQMLSNIVGRVTVDQTHLDGNFDLTIEFTPDRMPSPPPGPPPPGVPSFPPIDPNGPSLMTALQEQLGLKLEAAKGPVEVLVIDRVEAPSPD